MPIPHIPQDLQPGISIVVQTKYGPLRGGRTTNDAAIFLGNALMPLALVNDLPDPFYPLDLEVPYALPPVRFQDPQPLPEGYRYDDKHYVVETKRDSHFLSTLAHS